MKNLRNKVILSGIVLLFAFIATIGTTYAWFTVSSQASVESFDLTVSAQDNLLIQVDAGYTAGTEQVTTVGNYSSSVTLDEILDIPAYSNLQTFKLQPVTIFQEGYGKVDGKVLNALSNLTDYSRPLTAATANSVTEGHYIEISFWLYSQSDVTKNIALADNVAITTTETDPELSTVVNALRLSVYTDSTEAYVFGNDKDFGFEFLENNEGYAEGTLTDSNFNDLLNRDTALVDGSDELLTTVTNYEYVKDLGDESTTPTTLFTLASETPTKVTVKIFVEGWDAQAVNGIITAKFAILLGFKFA